MVVGDLSISGISKAYMGHDGTYLDDTPFYAILGVSRMLALETNILWELSFMRKSFLKRHVTTI
jgi:hypothetical protein